MKKSIISVTLALLLLTSCSDTAFVPDSDPMNPIDSAIQINSPGILTEEIRGAWIATVFNINFPSAPELPEKTLKAELDSIVDNARLLGLNALFFQVHPSSDALYRSSIFPVSDFLTRGDVLYFDPLEYIIETCHNNNISLHAWVNPLRVSTEKTDTFAEGLSKLKKSENNAIPEEYISFHADGRLYLDPGIPEARKLVSDCVREIVSNYDVDGVIFDDYFYPSAENGVDFDDAETYAEYGNSSSVGDWRRENVNKLIKECYNTVKQTDENCLFGVSPCGIWRNNDGANGGSDTHGMEGYSQIYCDALAWADGGYVDYLSPQLYWEIGNPAASFDELCNWWNTKLDGTGVSFVPSLASFRYDGDWSEPQGEITKQLDMSRNMISYRGAIYYGYDALQKNIKGVSDEIKMANSCPIYYTDPSKVSDSINVSAPITGSVTCNDFITVSGRSDPSQVLTLNGVVISRQKGGLFSTDYVLTPGENVICLKCRDCEKKLMIYKKYQKLPVR